HLGNGRPGHFAGRRPHSSGAEQRKQTVAPRAAMVMRAIDRKLVRDALSMKGQVLAICAVIACGVATFVMSRSRLEALRGTQQRYYDRYRFASIFAGLKRAPNTLAARIAQIPGVAYVQARVVRDVILDVPGLSEPAVGKLVSIPEVPRIDLNALHLRSG